MAAYELPEAAAADCACWTRRRAVSRVMGRSGVLTIRASACRRASRNSAVDWKASPQVIRAICLCWPCAHDEVSPAEQDQVRTTFQALWEEVYGPTRSHSRCARAETDRRTALGDDATER